MDNTLVAVLPGNKIGLFKPEEFRRLNIDQIKESKSFIFKLSIDSEISSIEDLDKLLKGPV